jgi:hypothetical protein
MARLLLFFAVLLMPLGMAPGAAMPVAHSSMAMSMPTGHCPEQGSNHDMKGGIAECTMACAGALPAVDLVNHEPRLIVCRSVQPTAAQQLDGLHPETATPPPKRS